MNRDQIIKGLECCTAEGIHCDACPYDSKKTLTLCLCDLKADALSLIKEAEANTVRKFADKLIAYYNSLDGKTSSVLTAYHIEQIAKEMMEE